MMRLRIGRIWLTLFLVLVLASKMWAQATWGAINGYVTDQTGASVPNANVTITNTQTDIQRKTATDSQGFYNVTHLDPGDYSIYVVAPTFKSTLVEHVTLGVDSTVRTDVKLAIGAVAQEVKVTASEDMLKAEKTDVAGTISEEEIQNVPLPNHNVSKEYLTVPGVLAGFWQIPTVENPSEFENTTVNGQFFNISDYLIDGIADVAFGFSGFQVIVPPQDAVQEMKVTTADYDPEFGSSAGMVTQIVTKSGTNDLYGSLYWYNRNPFTEKIPGTGPTGNGTGPAPFNQNEGGGSLGGPIRKDKMFFFGDYRLMRRVQRGEVLQTVPNDAFRNGDFSAVAATNPIFDPLTGNPDGTGRTQFSATAGENPACTSGGSCLNIIPLNRFNAVSQNLLALLPHANINQGLTNNREDLGFSDFDTDEIDGRYDWDFTQKSKFFVRYSYMWTYDDNAAIWGTAGGPDIGGLGAQVPRTGNTNAAINYTHIFSPNLLAEVRGGFTRFSNHSYQPDSTLDTSTQVGIPGVNLGGPLYGGLAEIDGDGPVSGGWFLGIQGAVPRLDNDNTWEAVNNWTWMRHSHQFRWGSDARRTEEDFFGDNTRGDFGMCQGVTGAPEVLGSGLGVATFELGQVCTFTRAHFNRFPHERETRVSLYGQDVWTINPKLTFNYGMRWDYFQPDVSGYSQGGLANFDYSTGQIMVAGYGNISKYADVVPQYRNFAPRLGLAYKMTQKTVLRAGFGSSYFTSGYQGNFNQLCIMYPVSAYQNINQTNQYLPVFSLDQGPPAPAPIKIPASGLITVTPDLSLTARSGYVNNGTSSPWGGYNYKMPNVFSWNLTYEQQLTRDLNVSLGYVGNTSRHVSIVTDTNAAPPGEGPLVNRRPLYQEFGISQGVSDYRNEDSADYNALDFVVKKRFRDSFSISSTFTWSKALNDQLVGGEWGDQSINPYDRKGSYGVSEYNRAAAWILTHTWRLPYGPGMKWGAGSTGIEKVALAGWEFNGFTTVESGFHFSPTMSSGSTLNADWGQRPNLVPGVGLYKGAHNRNEWFNPNAFAAPAACCVWGDAGKGIMTGPSYTEIDTTFGKTFAFKSPLNKEDTELDFRWEAFNLLNHTNLGLPNNAIDTPTAGQITSLVSPGTGWGVDYMRRMQFGIHLKW